MSELEKWQRKSLHPDSAYRSGWQCGNPKCGTVRKDANHWFTVSALMGDQLLVEPWNRHHFGTLPLGVFMRFAVCGEGCATVALSIHMAEVVANALQKKKLPTDDFTCGKTMKEFLVNE